MTASVETAKDVHNSGIRPLNRAAGMKASEMSNGGSQTE